MVSGKTLVAVGAGIGAVVAAPYALAAAGFTGAGVAACSLASWLQVEYNTLFFSNTLYLVLLF
jgi:hypothetical protein